MKLEPFYDNLIVRIIKDEQVSKAGIILPHQSDPLSPVLCEVVAVGPGRLTNNSEFLLPPVVVGEKVLISHNAGHIVITDESPLVLVGFRDLIAKVL